MFAVGTPVAGRPPHGSVRELLAHTALTSGVWRGTARWGTGAVCGAAGATSPQDGSSDSTSGDDPLSDCGVARPTARLCQAMPSEVPGPLHTAIQGYMASHVSPAPRGRRAWGEGSRGQGRAPAIRLASPARPTRTSSPCAARTAGSPRSEERERETPPGLFEKGDEDLEPGRLEEKLAIVAPQCDVVDRVGIRESGCPRHGLTSVRSIARHGRNTRRDCKSQTFRSIHLSKGPGPLG